MGGKQGDTKLPYVRSRFPEFRFDVISARNALEMEPASLFRFQSFEKSADDHSIEVFSAYLLRDQL